METHRLRAIAYEVFKTLNDQNPSFIREMFHCCPNITICKGNLYVHSRNATTFGNKNLSPLGAHMELYPWKY